MEKIKEFIRKNGPIVLGVVTSVLSFVGGMVVGNSLQEPPKKVQSLVIQPDYHKDFDEAVDAFRELQKTTKNAVLFDSFGEAYGVYDEAKLVNKRQ